MAPPDPLAAAKQLLASDPPAAARWAEAAYKAAPTAETTLLLAAAKRRSGDPAAAISLLTQLAAAAPRAWGVHYELGIARAATGDSTAALAALERALTLNPGAMLARHAFGDLRTSMGHAEQPPGPPRDPALQQASLAWLDGDPAAAEVLRGRFGLDRHDIAAACLIADIGAHSGRYHATATLLQGALRIAPGYQPARLRLAEALHRAERDEEALEPIEAMLAASPDVPIALALRGAILLRLGREAESAADLARVTELLPDRAHSWLAYGHALRTIGRRDDAIAAYRRSIAIEPALGEAYWSIADLKTASFTTGERAAMARALETPELPPPARSYFDFALGKACEDSGDYAEAFTHYARGNAIRRSIEPYDADAQHAFVRRMIDTLDRKALAGDGGDPSTAPIFVIGMPRAGSSLVEQILASHSQIEGVSELPTVTALARTLPNYPEGVAAIDAAAFGAGYLARVAPRRHTDRPHFVDKFPGNAFHVGLIHRMLPNSRIIDVRRNPLDCCVSLFAQSFAAGQAYSYDLADLGRHYAGHDALMRHISGVLPGRILRIDYEALVDDLEGETRRVLDHCGLAFEPQCLRFFENDRAVRTASSEQVRQPIYRTAIGRWRRFEPWLGPLVETLALQGVDATVTAR